ncbi:MAG: hypothetical protein H0W86_08135 [Armatimonadetes bacterium]|nr:hypothetical protein [Armatimonadota bacterium]
MFRKRIIIRFLIPIAEPLAEVSRPVDSTTNDDYRTGGIRKRLSAEIGLVGVVLIWGASFQHHQGGSRRNPDPRFPGRTLCPREHHAHRPFFAY